MYTPTYVIYTDLIYTLVFKKQKQKKVQNVEEKYIIHSFLSIWTNIQIFKLFVNLFYSLNVKNLSLKKTNCSETAMTRWILSMKKRCVVRKVLTWNGQSDVDVYMAKQKILFGHLKLSVSNCSFRLKRKLKNKFFYSLRVPSSYLSNNMVLRAFVSWNSLAANFKSLIKTPCYNSS